MKNKSIVEMREKVPVGVVEESDDLLVNVIQNMLVFYDLYGAGSVMVCGVIIMTVTGETPSPHPLVFY